MDPIPCPPAPKKGYSVCFYENQWTFVKTESNLKRKYSELN